jgi:hypothetical protein
MENDMSFPTNYVCAEITITNGEFVTCGRPAAALLEEEFGLDYEPLCTRCLKNREKPGQGGNLPKCGLCGQLVKCNLY